MRNESETINVLDLLTNQHAEVDDLIEQLENKEGDADEVFAELADKLAAHSAIEEKIFYPAVMQGETEEMLHEAVEEHLAIKRVLADMIELDPMDDEDEFKAKLAVLKEQVEHHAHEEEEGKLFPKLRRTVSADELLGLGNECLAMFEDLMRKDPSRNVAGETDHAAPLQ